MTTSRRPTHCHRPSRHAGFTLVEILVVVVIISTATAIVAPRILSSGTLGVQAASRMLIADLLYAQNEAIAQQKSIRVVFSPLPGGGNRYQLVYADGAALHMKWKGGSADTNNYVIDFDDDSRFSGVELTQAQFGSAGSFENYIEFDALGTPSAGGNVDLEFGDQHFRISVSDFTGRVDIQRVP